MASGSDSGAGPKTTQGVMASEPSRQVRSRTSMGVPRARDPVYSKIDYVRLEGIFRRELAGLSPEKASASFADFIKRIHALYIEGLPPTRWPQADSLYSILTNAKSEPWKSLVDEFRAQRKLFKESCDLRKLSPNPEGVSYSYLHEQPHELGELRALHFAWKNSGGALVGDLQISQKALVNKIFRGEPVVTGSEGVFWSERWGYIDLKRLNHFSENYVGPLGQLEFVRDLSIVLGGFVGMTNFCHRVGENITQKKSWTTLSLRWPHYYWLSRHVDFGAYADGSGRSRFLVDQLEGKKFRFDALCRLMLQQGGGELRKIPSGFVIAEHLPPAHEVAGELPSFGPSPSAKAEEAFHRLGIGGLLKMPPPKKKPT